MKIQKNVSLKNKNTFHIDAIAENLYIPENENEIIELLKQLKEEKYYILSGGSNVLLNNEKKYINVIYMSDIDKKIKQIKNEMFYIGCSNRIQKVINEINKKGYGGIERLFSLPAMFGGIIYMNAGIGGKNNTLFTISDFIKRVKVINKKTRTIEWISKENCKFSHRKSVFHNDEYIILGAECVFIKQKFEESKAIIKDRIERFSTKADMGNGTFGTVFSIANGKLLKISSILKSKKGNVRFGKNNKNWLVNNGNGTFKDAIELINNCKRIHKFFHKDIETEVRIWD